MQIGVANLEAVCSRVRKGLVDAKKAHNVAVLDLSQNHGLCVAQNCNANAKCSMRNVKYTNAKREMQSMNSKSNAQCECQMEPYFKETGTNERNGTVI